MPPYLSQVAPYGFVPTETVELMVSVFISTFAIKSGPTPVTQRFPLSESIVNCLGVAIDIEEVIESELLLITLTEAPI